LWEAIAAEVAARLGEDSAAPVGREH
jgi:hypothetical protein